MMEHKPFIHHGELVYTGSKKLGRLKHKNLILKGHFYQHHIPQYSRRVNQAQFL